MRVIAGKYRGKKLKEFEVITTRPTLDRVKEAIFSSIQFDVMGAEVLDLFSGTGNMGIEAISRGAKKTFFVDVEKVAIDLIKSNLQNITGDYEIHHCDFMRFLEDNKNKKFDIVFLDPPFATDFAERAIDFLINNDMIADKGIIIFEKSSEKIYSKEYENYNKITKKYGSVEVVFFKKI